MCGRDMCCWFWGVRMGKGRKLGPSERRAWGACLKDQRHLRPLKDFSEGGWNIAALDLPSGSSQKHGEKLQL